MLLHRKIFDPPMSAWGQQRDFTPCLAMSALHPKADKLYASPYVRFVPKPDLRTQQNRRLFDHLVGAREQLSKNGEAILLRHLGGQWFALFDHKSCNGFYGRCFLVDTFVDFAGFNIE